MRKAHGQQHVRCLPLPQQAAASTGRQPKAVCRSSESCVIISYASLFPCDVLALARQGLRHNTPLGCEPSSLLARFSFAQPKQGVRFRCRSELSLHGLWKWGHRLRWHTAAALLDEATGPISLCRVCITRCRGCSSIGSSRSAGTSCAAMAGGTEPAEPPPRRRHVTTAFVQRLDGAVLLVKRSGRVGTYQHQWGAISGGLEEGDESAAFRAQQEVRAAVVAG